MKIVSAEFLKSAARPDQFPRDGRPEVAFVGRSNVGKSSLLNTLLNRKDLAKTSATPGKTQLVNFFTVNGRCYFVDLPGYGFAKVPMPVKEAWNRLMHQYLGDREPLRLAALLLDARHKPSSQDAAMLEMLGECRVPTVLVATKTDKLSKSQAQAGIRQIRAELGLDADAVVVPFSSVTGQGRKELLDIVGEQFEQNTPAPPPQGV
ncbi:MAG: YihA family ribosome biogenesis GTP-binding protein [Candidatus Hydrogenedentes bacterium]|nr:YihA family ribosome biogenesis GTP-binding protein [Candidatus Hydrogenedentota bacterium]